MNNFLRITLTVSYFFYICCEALKEMELFYQEFINKIDNCPLNNEEREIQLFRLIINSNTCEKDLEPKAVNPRNKNMQEDCLGWGLSTYNTLEAALNNYNGMNEHLKSRFSHIASVIADSNFGVKYQTGDSKHHYTLFPGLDEKVLSKFTTIQKL